MLQSCVSFCLSTNFTVIASDSLKFRVKSNKTSCPQVVGQCLRQMLKIQHVWKACWEMTQKSSFKIFLTICRLPYCFPKVSSDCFALIIFGTAISEVSLNFKRVAMWLFFSCRENDPFVWEFLAYFNTMADIFLSTFFRYKTQNTLLEPIMDNVNFQSLSDVI